VREGVSSALAARDAFDSAVVLDLFAGTGAWAFEALSRGASRAVLVDHDRRVCQLISDNAATLGLSAECTVVGCNLLADHQQLLKRLPADLVFTLVFVDPPYAEIAKVPALLAAIVKRGVIAPGASVVVERASRDPAPGLHFLAPVATYRYGDTAVDLLRLPPGAEPT